MLYVSLNPSGDAAYFTFCQPNPLRNRSRNELIWLSAWPKPDLSYSFVPQCHPKTIKKPSASLADWHVPFIQGKPFVLEKTGLHEEMEVCDPLHATQVIKRGREKGNKGDTRTYWGWGAGWGVIDGCCCKRCRCSHGNWTNHFWILIWLHPLKQTRTETKDSSQNQLTDQSVVRTRPNLTTCGGLSKTEYSFHQSQEGCLYIGYSCWFFSPTRGGKKAGHSFINHKAYSWLWVRFGSLERQWVFIQMLSCRHTADHCLHSGYSTMQTSLNLFSVVFF